MVQVRVGITAKEWRNKDDDSKLHFQCNIPGSL